MNPNDKRTIIERESILEHKYYMSQKKGHEVDFSVALLDWALKYRDKVMNSCFECERLYKKWFEREGHQKRAYAAAEFVGGGR